MRTVKLEQAVGYYGGAIGCLSFIALQLGTLRRTGRLLRGRYPIARTWN